MVVMVSKNIFRQRKTELFFLKRCLTKVELNDGTTVPSGKVFQLDELQSTVLFHGPLKAHQFMFPGRKNVNKAFLRTR